MNLKVAVSGATGFVGKSLVPMLLARGVEVLLVGRAPERITTLFSGIAACNYDALERDAAGFDLFLHLAAVNNDASVPEQSFFDVNVDLALSSAAAAQRAGIPRFVYVSSIHALDDKNLSPYARSKRQAVVQLDKAFPGYAIAIYLPSIYADQWAGKLSRLNRMPGWLAKGLFSILSALKPTVHVARLADFIMGGGGEPLEPLALLSDGQLHNPVYRLLRRFLDLGFALAITVLFWWLLLLVWVAIKLDSPGPGLFLQKRVGRAGKVFTCYKFRTMQLGTVEAETNRVSIAAVTRIGHFLRRSKIDELPQVWNIFRNQISLVGPRPCLPNQVELIEARRLRAVHLLKPGITGLAQVNGVDMSNPVRLAQWDARYACLQSLLLDLKIIVATALGKGGGDRVRK